MYATVELLDLWLVFWNGVFQQALDFVRRQLVQLRDQFEHATADALEWQRLTKQLHDLGVTSCRDMLPLIAEFFEQLFARAESSELDLNILIGRKTGDFDQLPRQVHDLDRLAHVQGEDLTAESQGSALQHEPDGFRNGHEIAHDIRMSDFDRPTGGNLLVENRHDTARRTQHIAEPHRHETGCFRVSFVERLHAHFRQSFGCPHDVGRIDGLIARDEDE